MKPSSGVIRNFVASQIIIYCWATGKLTIPRIRADHFQNLINSCLVQNWFILQISHKSHYVLSYPANKRTNDDQKSTNARSGRSDKAQYFGSWKAAYFY